MHQRSCLGKNQRRIQSLADDVAVRMASLDDHALCFDHGQSMECSPVRVS